MEKRSRRFVPLWRTRGQTAFWWLCQELLKNGWMPDKSVSIEEFGNLLQRALERDPKLYKLGFREKASGGKRLISVPIISLRKAQKLIKKLVASRYVRATNNRGEPCIFGFSGGSVRQALEPHAALGYPIFAADVRKAFPSTDANAVFGFWRRQGFSWYVSFYLTALCTWPLLDGRQSSLPQGAPTSPWLFDACFTPIDRQLIKLAEDVGGCYTRYADNLFFSAPEFSPNDLAARRERVIKAKQDFSFFIDERENDLSLCDPKLGLPLKCSGETGKIRFASPLLSAVFRIVGRGYFLDKKSCTKKLASLASSFSPQVNYRLHKCFVWSPQSGYDFLGLGLRIHNKELHNRRRFKEDLRHAIKRLEWLLKNQRPWEEIKKTYIRLDGLMNFAIRETLPEPLLNRVDDLLLQVFRQMYSGPSGTLS